MRNRPLLIVVAAIVLVLLACVAIGIGGVVWYVLSGSIDIPYPDGPPSPSILP